MLAGRLNIGRILVERGLLRAEQVQEVLRYQANRGVRFGEAVIELGFCSDADVARALAEQVEVPFVDLRESPPVPAVVELLPHALCVEHGLVAVRMEKGALVVAARDPFDVQAGKAVRQATGMPFVLAIAPQSQIQGFLTRDAAPAAGDRAASAGAGRRPVGAASLDEAEVPLAELTADGPQLTAEQVVAVLLREAVRRGASSLHLEPAPDRVSVRIRRTGALEPLGDFPTRLLSGVATRLRLLAGLDVSQSGAPQGGTFRFTMEGRGIGVRLSILPARQGESIVARLSDRPSELLSLQGLGIPAETLGRFRALVEAREGMVLVAGPHGSGTTTVFYAAMAHRAGAGAKVVSVADPLETEIPGVTQVPSCQTPAARMLKGALDHDPDVLGAAEIQDGETGLAACRAAFSGRLTLGSLRAADSAAGCSRLSDLGVPRSVAAAALTGVLSPRLLPAVCETCAGPEEPSTAVLRTMDAFRAAEGAVFRRGKGCEACHGSGARGRQRIFEILVMEGELRERFAAGASAAELRRIGAAHGMVSLIREACRKAREGLVPVEAALALILELESA